MAQGDSSLSSVQTVLNAIHCSTQQGVEQPGQSGIHKRDHVQKKTQK